MVEPELIGQARGMQRCGTAKGDEGAAARVFAALDRVDPCCVRHVLVDNLADDLSVGGYPGSVWVTNQQRTDKDWAIFGEANWDITKQLNLQALVGVFMPKKTNVTSPGGVIQLAFDF